jgi:hypothetical protein
MGIATPDILLSALLVGVLVAITSVIALGQSCPPTSDAYRQLFSRGSVPPYTGMTSLRTRFLLPWHPSPNFAGCRPYARWLLGVARLGAAIALVALATLITLWVRSAWI